MIDASQFLREREVLVFDLDGTLVDSAPDIRGTLDLALQDCGIAGVKAGDLVDLHSPLADIVHGALAQRGVAASQASGVIAAYRHRLALCNYENSAPYVGVKDYLAERLREGHRLAVCTNKIHAEALRMLGHFGLLGLFSTVVGADSAHSPKPHAAPMELVLQRLDAQPHQAVLVGDTHVDAQCARNAGVGFVWHRPGYGDPQQTAPLAHAAFDSWHGLLQAEYVPV